MFRDGSYVVWFRTPRGSGTGIVHLSEGSISGGDAFITYGGSYERDGDRFTATLTTKRHTAGQPTVFGIDEVELKLTGISNETIAVCSASADQMPGIPFEATLILNRQEERACRPAAPVRSFNVEKLLRGLQPG
jgi:hypothetical protein